MSEETRSDRPAWWANRDRIPHPEYGNTLTVRQYQTKWLAAYRQLAGGVLPVGGCNLPGGGGVIGIGCEIPADIAPVIAYAQAQLGKPYVWGGSGPDVFDCSGLTLRAYQTISNQPPPLVRITSPVRACHRLANRVNPNR